MIVEIGRRRKYPDTFLYNRLPQVASQAFFFGLTFVLALQGFEKCIIQANDLIPDGIHIAVIQRTQDRSRGQLGLLQCQPEIRCKKLGA